MLNGNVRNFMGLMKKVKRLSLRKSKFIKISEFSEDNYLIFSQNIG